MTSTLDS